MPATIILRGLSAALFAVTTLLFTVPIARAADVNVTNDPNYRWGELQMVVNPKNPNNIVIFTVGVGFTKKCQEQSSRCKMVDANFGLGRPFPQPVGMFSQPDFNRVNVYTSFDRGKSWRRVFLPIHPPEMVDLQGTGDPSITVAPDGTFYASWDDNNWGTPEHGIPNTAIAVSKSTDGGLTWSDPTISGTPTNGPKITADQTTGTVYVGSTGPLGPRASGDPKTPEGKISDRWLVSTQDGVKWTTPHAWGGDEGEKHHSAPGAFSAAHGVLAAVARVTDAAACTFLVGGGAPCIVFQTTSDSGVTWKRHRVPLADAPGTMVMIAADPTKQSHFAVAISSDGNKGFVVFQTRDAGMTWSGPTKISEDATKVHFKPWLAYSRQGALAIMWRTYQPTSGQAVPSTVQGGPGGGPVFPYNIWAALSKDGGATFSEPLKVSSKDSDAPDASTFGGAGDDYSALAVDADNVYIAWAHWLGDARDNFFTAVKFSAFVQAKH